MELQQWHVISLMHPPLIQMTCLLAVICCGALTHSSLTCLLAVICSSTELLLSTAAGGGGPGYLDFLPVV